jgi:hypothetical protein
VNNCHHGGGLCRPSGGDGPRKVVLLASAHEETDKATRRFSFLEGDIVATR